METEDRYPVASGRRKSRVRLVAVAAGLTFAVGACSPSDPVGEGSEDDSPDNGDGEQSELVLGVETVGAQDWTPWLSGNEEEFVTRLIGDVLIRVNEEGEMVPGIATSWELSDDLSTWTFEIRDDVPFQDGYGTITAEDVKFSFEQFLHPDSNQSISNLLSRALQGDIDNFEVVSPTEFKIHMDPEDPVIYLATTLSQAVPGLPIQSQAYFEEMGEDAYTHPHGSGPYRFVSSTPGVEVVLEAVEDHWRQTSEFDRIRIKIVPDEAARLNQLQTGELDLAPLSPRLMEEAEAAGLQAYRIPDVGTASVVLGGQYHAQPDKHDCEAPWIQCDSPEQARAIREAMSLAIDREAILENVFFSHGNLTYAPSFSWPATRPSTVDPSWDLPEYDPELAQEMLAEGGYPDGFDISQWIYLDVPGSIEAGEALAGMWEDIGLTVNREVVEYRPIVRPALMEQTTQDHAFIYFQSNYAESVQSIATANHSTSTFQAFTDSIVDEYYEEMSVEPDKQRREELARELMTELREKHHPIPLFTTDAPYAASEKVGSWNPVGGYELPTNLEYITDGS